MRLLRYLIVSGSAAAMAGAVTFSGVTAIRRPCWCTQAARGLSKA